MLWGQELRFVLVWMKRILVTTDLTLEPVGIIELYAVRFKIECAFRELKRAMGVDYHFWSKSMPKLNRYLKKDELHPLALVDDEKVQQDIRLTVKAIEKVM